MVGALAFISVGGSSRFLKQACSTYKSKQAVCQAQTVAGATRKLPR